MGIDSIFGIGSVGIPEIVILVVVYFLPYLLASFLKQEKLTMVFFANLLFGWTGIGWFAVLIWVLFSKFGVTK